MFVAAPPVDGRCEVTVTHPDDMIEVLYLSEADAAEAANLLRNRLAGLEWVVEVDDT